MSLLDMDENIAYCRVFSKFASMKDKDIISLLNDNPLPKSLEIDTLLLNTFFRKNYSTALYSLSLSQKNLRKILESADKPNKTIKATGSNISIYCSYSQFIKVQLIATLQLINNEINENRFKEIYQKSIKDILFKNAVEVDFPG